MLWNLFYILNNLPQSHLIIFISGKLCGLSLVKVQHLLWVKMKPPNSLSVWPEAILECASPEVTTHWYNGPYTLMLSHLTCVLLSLCWRTFIWKEDFSPSQHTATYYILMHNVNSGIGKGQYLFFLFFIWVFFSQLNLKALYSLYVITRHFIFKSSLISKARDNLPSIFFLLLFLSSWWNNESWETKYFLILSSLKGFKSITFSNVFSTTREGKEKKINREVSLTQ